MYNISDVHESRNNNKLIDFSSMTPRLILGTMFLLWKWLIIGDSSLAYEKMGELFLCWKGTIYVLSFPPLPKSLLGIPSPV